MSSRFTERAQRVILLAQEDAKRWQHGLVEPLHLLAALLGLGQGTACQILAGRGFTREEVEKRAMKTLQTDSAPFPLGEVPFTPDAKRVLEHAVEEAQRFRHSYVGTEHLLLGMFHLRATEALLTSKGLTLETARSEILKIVGEGNSPPPNSPEPVRTTYLGQQLLVISMTPEVSGILLTPGTSDSPTIIVLLKDGTTPDSAYRSLKAVLPNVDRLRFKQLDKRPVGWKDGAWVEDSSFPARLTF